MTPMKWVVDAGEHACLTPEGPTAALIASRGPLPLRVRTDRAGRFSHPGTAVTLDGRDFEVVAEEQDARGVVYRLEPWPADHVIRDRVDYGSDFVAAAAGERRRRWLRRLPGADTARLGLEIVAALLPRRERQALAARYHLDVIRGTWAAGALGAVGGLLAWVLALVASMREMLAAGAGQLRDVPPVAGELTSRASPLFFVLSPLGLTLAYVFLTSGVRWLNVAFNAEALADPLLALLAWAGRLVTSGDRRLRSRLGPPRPDRLSVVGDGLVVLAAREKPGWNQRATIQVEDRFYRLRAVEERPDGDWIALAHVLEPLPQGAVLRSLVRYEPPGRPPVRAAPISRPPRDVATEPRPAAAPRPSGGRWYVDDGEEARLTPEGPSAAVIESLGALPLRARIPGEGSHRPTFPGTAVLLGAERFEVVAEEVLETGVRYRLDPWPADHILRGGVQYSPRLVRAAQRERDRAVEVERARRWSWLLYPLVGLLPETRQIMVCERLGLEASMATFSGALLEAMLVAYGALLMTSPLESLRMGEGLGFGWAEKAGWLIGPILIRAFGGLAFGEVGGSLLLGFAFHAAQVLKPSAARYDASVLPMTRDAFWARLALPDRHQARPEGSIVVTSLLPHLTWGASSATARVAAGPDWWSVTRLPPAIEKGRLTYRYQLVPLGDPELGAPQAPGVRQYQQEVLAEVDREWDDLLTAGSWLVSLLPEDAQQRAYGSRGGPAASRTSVLVTAGIELAMSLWLLRPTVVDLLTAGFLVFDGGRRMARIGQGRYAPSLVGGLVSDFLPPERHAYHKHLDAERQARLRPAKRAY